MARRKPTAFNLATGMGFAGLHAGITLYYRLPMLAASLATQSGRSTHAREVNRMMSEKAAAAVYGLFDAQKAMLQLTGAAIRHPFDFAVLAKAPIAIADAALQPAMRKVRANSRRLSRAR